MRRLLVTWLFNFGAIWVAAKLLDGIHYADLWTLIVAALVFSIVNIFVKPIITLLALPFIVVTLGFALFFINLLMLFLTGWIVDGFSIDGFWWGVAGTIIIWIVNAVLHAAFPSADEPRSAHTVGAV